MDLTTILILIAMPALVGLGLLTRSQLIRLRRRRKLRQRLKKIICFHHLKPFKEEYFCDKLLVLDVINKKMVFLDYFSHRNDLVIDLQELDECKLLVRRLVVQLDIKFNNPCKEAFSIVFHQRFADPDYLRSSLTTKARVWKELLTKSIENNRDFEYGISG